MEAGGLVQGVDENEVHPSWCHWWSLRGHWGSFGALGRTWWVPGGLSGSSGMSLELLGFMEDSWGLPEKSGIETQMFVIVSP